MPLARDIKWNFGSMEPGPCNAITDVPGVGVGHSTVNQGDLHTGVTAILPHGKNIYREKVPAAACVINGFGKSVGLMQVNELGNLETPILLTNTFAVGACSQALIRRAINENPDIGRETSTVNPVVCECNDGHLNDIQVMAITEENALAAIADSRNGNIMQGSVGAGTGMCCFGFKGGIGTASRRIRLDDSTFHLGILTLTNFGRPGDLILPDGRRVGLDPKIHPVHGSKITSAQSPAVPLNVEKGSVIIILATDIPLDHRQLMRVTRRCGAGLARLGSFWGNGSGDIVIGFSTASRINHDEPRDTLHLPILNENRIDTLFEAACDTTQEAVFNSMLMSPQTTGRSGHFIPGLASAV